MSALGDNVALAFKTCNELRERIATLTAERDELLSHRMNGDPENVGWHSARTVGHLRMQLETLDPSTPVTCVYFIRIDDLVIARSTGIQLSWESIDSETNCIAQRPTSQRTLALWAHENDGFGPEVLRYLGRGDELLAAKGFEGNVLKLWKERKDLGLQVEDMKSALWRLAHEALDLYGEGSEQAVQNRIETELKISVEARRMAKEKSKKEASK